MPVIEAKCTALLLYRMYLQGQRNGTVTAAQLQTWNLSGRQANPLHSTKFPINLACLYVYAVNMAYITPPELDEAPRCFRRRIYVSIHSTALALKGARGIRIMTQQPTTPWSKVWGNLHAVWPSEELKAAWFIVIHDLIPTNDQLTKIQRSTTNKCQHCGRIDTGWVGVLIVGQLVFWLWGSWCFDYGAVGFLIVGHLVFFIAGQ